MKKVIVLLLASLLAVCLLGACGGNNGDGNSSNKTVWKIEESVDEFGDVTEDSYEYLASEFSGTFSNTATTDGELSGKVGIGKKTDGHYLVGFNLLENKQMKASFNDSDNSVLKVKVDDTVYEYPLSGYAPVGSLVFGGEDFDYSGDEFFNLLYAGNDLRCVIEIGSSKYNFDIINGNFTEFCEKNDVSKAPAELTLDNALAILLEDKGLYFGEIRECLNKHKEEFERVGSSTMFNELNGCFLQVHVVVPTPYDSKMYPDMDFCIYSENEKNSFAGYDFNEGFINRGGREYAKHNRSQKLSTENDLLILYGSNDKKIEYQVYKVTNGLYILYQYFEDEDDYTIPEMLVRFADQEAAEEYVYARLNNQIDEEYLLSVYK